MMWARAMMAPFTLFSANNPPRGTHTIKCQVWGSDPST